MAHTKKRTSGALVQLRRRKIYASEGYSLIRKECPVLASIVVYQGLGSQRVYNVRGENHRSREGEDRPSAMNIAFKAFRGL